jgi:alpha-L-rhamnosidase
MRNSRCQRSIAETHRPAARFHWRRAFQPACVWLLILAGLGAVALAGEADRVNVTPADTGAALINPGMGWVLHFYDNIPTNYGSRLEPSDTVDDFPGLTVVYLRIPWSYIEPEEGKFNWAVVDTPAQRWIAKGKQVAFRFTCTESWMRWATPEWVHKAGAKGYNFKPGQETATGPYWEPEYDDPVFLEKLDHFLAAAASRYDGNPEVAFIDVGSFGVWGEGHTWASTRRKWPASTLIRHIDLYRRHFKKTLLAANDDFVFQGDEVIAYALKHGLTLRDDSILVQGGTNAYFHAAMAQPFWPRLPVILESEHYGPSRDRGNWKDGSQYLQAVEDYHASYASIHWWPREFLAENKDLIARMNRRMGYRLQLVQASWPKQVPARSAFSFRAQWRNAGVAPCLPGGHPAVTFKDDPGGLAGVFVDDAFEMRTLPVGPPGRAEIQRQSSAFVLPFNLKPGTYSVFMSVGTLTGTPRLALPLADDDGQRRYRLGTITVIDAADLSPSHLRSEYLTDPIGLGRPQPRLSWVLDSAERGQKQTAYQILAAPTLAGLEQDQGSLWDSGRVESDETAHVVYQGKPLSSRAEVFWKVRVWDKDRRASAWSQPSRWQMGLLNPGDWRARWIADAAELPPITRAGPKEVERSDAQPVTMLRKAFELPARPVRAVLYASALGVYELHLNGQRVGDHVLAPEWTDYHKRVQYQAYDVTALLRNGDNVVGAFLGDGWYAGRLGMSDGLFQKLRGVYGRKPYLIAQLEIQLEDGRPLTVVTDPSWFSAKSGPIRRSDLLDGEVYDATHDLPGWDAPGFQAEDWRPAGVLDSAAPQLVAQPNEPIRITRELRPVALTEPKPGVFIFDLGQNMVGWCRLRLKGPPGTQVTLRYGEMLNDDGSLYTANLRSAPQIDRYTLRGAAAEVFEPHFTYHGFRYVEVTGLQQKPSRDTLAGCVFHSSSPEAGQFECSEPMLNRLWQNILWTQRANLMSVPTDCPQRDERLGWMGDIQAFSQTGIFNMDLAGFFTKWLQDIRDAQADDGRFADFSPHPYGPNERFSGAPAWADAGVLVPWRAYVNYGDKRILERQFDAAERWIEFVRAHNPDLIWRKNRGNDYNDWLNGDTLRQQGWPSRGAAVPNDLFATAFFAHSTELVSKMAKALDRPDDARRYAALSDAIKAAFRRAFEQPDGALLGNTQAGYALALHFDLLPQAARAAAAKRMADGVREYHDHISTGIQSTHRLMLELTRYGYHDLAWQLLTNRTFPSWGYMIENGATTIWERWDGYVKGRGFQDPGMNSFNHWAFGAVGEWMFRNLAGINPDERNPGYKHFIIQPRPTPGLAWVKAGYDSIRGRIESQWSRDGNTLTLEVRIPPNTTATVYVPASEVSSVREGRRRADREPGVRFTAIRDGAAVFELGSGLYRFTATE